MLITKLINFHNKHKLINCLILKDGERSIIHRFMFRWEYKCNGCDSNYNTLWIIKKNLGSIDESL